ncbi:hypothetical protein Tco_0782527 [Tanacetum coccineum]
MDPYEEVAQQRHVTPLSPTYVPDPMKLDEHVPVYVLELEHREYHVPSDDDIQVEDQSYADDASPTAESPRYIADSDSMEEDTDEDSIDYLDEPEDPEEDDDEDPEEDPSEEHEPEHDDEDPKEDLNEEHKPRDEDTKKEPQTPMAASTQALIDVFAAGSRSFPLPPTSPAYDQAPLVESSAAAAARAPKGQYDFVDTVEAEQGLIRSPGHDARTIARATDRAGDIGYVRALQASEHMMMTSIEEVNLRASYQAQVCKRESENFYTQLLDARTDRSDIRLEIDVVRGQRTAYETKLHECQSAEDFIVRQMMCTQVLEARARIDTVEDAGSSC